MDQSKDPEIGSIEIDKRDIVRFWLNCISTLTPLMIDKKIEVLSPNQISINRLNFENVPRMLLDSRIVGSDFYRDFFIQNVENLDRTRSSYCTVWPSMFMTFIFLRFWLRISKFIFWMIEQVNWNKIQGHFYIIINRRNKPAIKISLVHKNWTMIHQLTRVHF